MHRFLSHSSLIGDALIIAKSDPLYHQIGHVFRARRGQELLFFEAHGPDIRYEIIDIGRHEIKFQKKETLPLKQKNKKNQVTLYQSYPNKIATLELIVQKIVELGIEHLVLIPSDHSQMKMIPPSKLQRITSIAQEALEQSGGNAPLMISEMDSIEIALSVHHDMAHIVGLPEGEKMIQKQNSRSLGFWVGPEGGWSEGEVEFFQRNGISLWCFNDNILRLETAAIVGCGILSYFDAK